MENLKALKGKELLNKVYKSNTLTKCFWNYVKSIKNDYIHDITKTLFGCSYCFELYSNNFLEIHDYDDFMRGIKIILSKYPMNDAVKDAYNSAANAKDNNSRSALIDDLGDVLYDYLNQLCADIEAMLHNIDFQRFDDEFYDMLEGWKEFGELNDVFVDDNGDIIEIKKLI